MNFMLLIRVPDYSILKKGTLIEFSTCPKETQPRLETTAT